MNITNQHIIGARLAAYRYYQDRTYGESYSPKTITINTMKFVVTHGVLGTYVYWHGFCILKVQNSKTQIMA
jgi:hypothetical protein